METGWDELLRAMASDLEVIQKMSDPIFFYRDFWTRLTHFITLLIMLCIKQNWEDHLSAVMLNPMGHFSFIITLNEADFILSWRVTLSKEQSNWFSGVVREVARRIYDSEVIMKVQERKQEHLGLFL